jgi:hypothetical protein
MSLPSLLLVSRGLFARWKRLSLTRRCGGSRQIQAARCLHTLTLTIPFVRSSTECRWPGNLLHDNELLATTTEEDELALLRAENALLKKKLKALEKGGRGDKPGL